MVSPRSLGSLEFHKLLEIIAKYAASDAGQASVLSLAPLDSIEEIRKRASCIEEIRVLSQEGEPLNILPFKDIGPALHKAHPEDSVLEPSELVGIMDFLAAAYEVAENIKTDEDLLALSELAENLSGKPELLRILRKSIDREGAILDTASPLLSSLRAERKRLEAKIVKRLEEMVRDERLSTFLQDSFITQRSGRWVIPVRMDSKGQVQGVVHDVSKSGDTAFVEPMGIIGVSNELENIIADEKGEEIRILRDLSARVRADASEMEEEFRILVYFDLLNSISVFAEQHGLHTPEVSGTNILRLVNARHPLLIATSGSIVKIMPIDVSLGGEDRVMVITGPNAGGKTVTIKTIGIIAAMALCGMPVPADSSTIIPMLNNMLVDIGDRQSIEEHLSTFAAHIENIAGMLGDACPETLVLVDELGTGTDPEEGSALSCAILKEMKERGALTFATTHLTGIKAFAHKSDGMLNASMDFDLATNTPLYKLRVGEPGQSHAIETARRYGLPEHVIRSAKDLLGRKDVELDSLIHECREKIRHYEESLKDLEDQRRNITGREERLALTIKDTESKKRESLSDAYKEASEIILNTKRQMNILFEDLKKRGKEEAKEVFKEVHAAHKAVEEKIKEYAIEEIKSVSINEISVGDAVFVKSLGCDAIVVKIMKKDNRLKVRAGNKEVDISVDDAGIGKGKPVEKASSGVSIETADETASARINVIGMRVDESLSEIEPFLNRATLAGLREVVIVHGVGAGILSKNIREYLAVHPLIESFREGAREEGGAGVTIAVLK